ncbi:MAG TPA: type II secretion system F family protein [Actinoallomurus sp.]|nr:type II secretion system F family protein [Actinoallomurus sp.]
MIIILAAGCVFGAVWVASSPPPAAIRLTTVIRAPREASGHPRAAKPQALTRSTRASAAAARLRLLSSALSRRRRNVAARRTAVIELCDGTAAELTAGRPAGTALAQAASVLPDLPELASIADAAPEDVIATLTRASAVEGCDGLRLLAGCWRIGIDRGGMLASVIEGLAEALRDEQSHREEIALQLSGPRATARLLAGLPALGLGMAAALGAKPLQFLFTTMPGVLCLSLGSGLDILGLWWTSRLATAAEQNR